MSNNEEDPLKEDTPPTMNTRSKKRKFIKISDYVKLFKV
jgi:hypothetical protein